MSGEIVLAVIGGLFMLLGSWLAYRGTRGKTQADVRTSSEKRVDDKIAAYTDRMESRVEKVEQKNDELESKASEQDGEIKVLRADLKITDRINELLYHHTKDLREHIVLGKPPPPPSAPSELTNWFENFEDTLPKA